jgi:hypothetical protein
MRRTAAAVVAASCALGVVAAGSASPAGASQAGRSAAAQSAAGPGQAAKAAHGQASRGRASRGQADHGRATAPTATTRARPATRKRPAARAAAAGTKIVKYAGYEFPVPAGWPVYHLDSDPSRCVRYDVNAVYLGDPGADQDCPPGIVGRGETITVAPAGAPGVPRMEYQRAAVAQGGLGASFPEVSAHRHAAAIPAVQGSVDQYADDGEFRATLPHSGLSVTATYGADPAQVEDVLQGIRKAPAAPAKNPATSPGHSRAASRGPVTGGASGGAAAHGMADSAGVARPMRAGSPDPMPAKTPASPEPVPSPSQTLSAHLQPTIPAKPLNGFDTCTAPSLSAMNAWRSKYSAIGIYIGGQDMACDYGNLSRSWIAQVHKTGWSLLPIYVGLQAPCNSFHGKINAKSAGSQGRTAADAAVRDAVNFGLGKGSPVYFDMEAYNNSNSGCRTAVLTFLDAWTRELHARGYVSGVYSSASSGVADLVAAATINGHAMADPDALWFALWDNAGNLTGTPYLPKNRWPSDRDKQYAGGHNRKIGGYTLNIDSDRVGGAVSAP